MLVDSQSIEWLWSCVKNGRKASVKVLRWKAIGKRSSGRPKSR